MNFYAVLGLAGANLWAAESGPPWPLVWRPFTVDIRARDLRLLRRDGGMRAQVWRKE